LNPVGQNSSGKKSTFCAKINSCACYPGQSPFHAVIWAQSNVKLGLCVATWNREKQEAQLSLADALQPTQFLLQYWPSKSSKVNVFHAFEMPYKN